MRLRRHISFHHYTLIRGKLRIRMVHSILRNPNRYLFRPRASHISENDSRRFGRREWSTAGPAIFYLLLANREFMLGGSRAIRACEFCLYARRGTRNRRRIVKIREILVASWDNFIEFSCVLMSKEMYVAAVLITASISFLTNIEFSFLQAKYFQESY